MQLVTAKDPATFTKAHNEATSLQELTKVKKTKMDHRPVPLSNMMNMSTKSGAMVQKICTMEAVEVKDVEPHVEDLRVKEVTTMETADQQNKDQETTNNKIKPRLHFDTALSQDIVKKNVIKVSRTTN
jgi:hypothetical protein